MSAANRIRVNPDVVMVRFARLNAPYESVCSPEDSTTLPAPSWRGPAGAVAISERNPGPSHPVRSEAKSRDLRPQPKLRAYPPATTHRNPQH